MTSERAKVRTVGAMGGWAAALLVMACSDWPRGEPLAERARDAACALACADGRCGGDDCVRACSAWLARWRAEWAQAWIDGTPVGRGRPPPTTPALAATLSTCWRAPICPLVVDCDDPRWPWLGDAVLDGITDCLLGPCEVRAACLAAALPADGVCRIDGGAE